MVQGLWQYPARIEPVYVPASESETFAAAWGQAVVPPGMLRKGRWVPGLSGWGCPGQAWEVPWIDATVGSGWASTPPSRPQSATTEPVLNPAPAAVEWGWQAELPVPALSRSRTQRAEPAMVLYEPVDAVLPPFEWYCGLEPPTPATRVAWRGATGSLTLLPSLWATEYEPGVGYFEISDHFSLGMFP